MKKLHSNNLEEYLEKQVKVAPFTCFRLVNWGGLLLLNKDNTISYPKRDTVLEDVKEYFSDCVLFYNTNKLYRKISVFKISNN